MLWLQRRQSEKMFEAYIRKRFKANSTPFDISASSAFKPTKPLDIRLTSTSAVQQPLISPITGQPLSHVPAPLLLSSSAHSAGAAAGAAGPGVAATSFRLARSSTQPLQSPRVVHLASQGQGQAGAGAGGNKPSAQSTLLRQHSINDSFSLSEQLTLSLGNDSENIFEMSGVDDDSAIQSLGDEAAQAKATATSAAASTAATTTTTLTNQSSTPTTTSGLTRSNSVRARANMFQQLQQQEQTRNRRDSHGGGGGSGEPQQQQQQRSTIANRQAVRQSTPPPASNTQGSPTHDETSTPNTTHDAEFEPSSLSLAERLAFFTSLCDTGSGGGGIGSCRTSSYSKSPPMDRTPRSSTTVSSASVTPTPMECSPLLQEDHPIQPYQPRSLTLESINEHNSQNSSNLFHALSRSATEPTAVLCDQQQSDPQMLPGAVSSITKIKIRTVGKLIMPVTFMGDRNNNNNATINHHNSSKACLGRLQTLEEVKISMGVRTIGKIKSPFIEQQQQQQHSILLTNGGGSSSNQSDSDSGKENCASNEQKDKTSPQKVSEMRRKITRLVQQQQLPQAQPVQRRHTTEITTRNNTGSSSTNSNNNRSSLVDERYAKYFGCKDSFKNTTVLKTESMPLPSTLATPTPQEQQQQQQQQQQQNPQAEATNEYVRLPTVSVGKRRELLKRTRPMSFESSIYTPTNGAGNIICGGGSFSPTAMPSPKRAHSPGNRIKAMISCYDDIIVTPAELNAAGKEFHRLCEESSVG
ncbi:mucin-4 isoform X4 [Drosophila willistoni]|uniref:mucin-4 isoform X4 n=1 Tax=Drosophila willistoni TaxID=7260 RepID=UPI000C26D69C|nr:mucin-4 isoform X4 [Drosophila willistoni]